MESMTDAPPVIGEYSPMMLWEMQKMTNERLEEHCRIHKTDIDNLYAKIDKNHRDQTNDSTEIKQSLAEISQSVSLLAQKIECKPEPAPAHVSEDSPTGRGGYAWSTGAVIAILFGVSQFVEFFKR